MNAEQKQRALAALGMWHSSNDDSLREYQSAELMVALLQELVDAPEVKPAAWVLGYYAGYLSVVTVDGRVLPTGTALYLAPPASSVPDEELQAAFDRGLKAGNELKDAQQVEIHRLHGLLTASQPPSEPPADVARDAERYRWLTANHASAVTRFDVHNIASSIRVRSYAATSAAIDAARERQGGE